MPASASRRWNSSASLTSVTSSLTFTAAVTLPSSSKSGAALMRIQCDSPSGSTRRISSSLSHLLLKTWRPGIRLRSTGSPCSSKTSPSLRHAPGWAARISSTLLPPISLRVASLTYSSLPRSSWIVTESARLSSAARNSGALSWIAGESKAAGSLETSAPTRQDLQGGVLPALVDLAQIRARRDDLVDAVEQLVGELDVGRRQLRLQVLHRARADDRGGHRRVADDERERQLDQAHAALLGELAERVGGVELALIAGVVHVVAGGQALRAPRLRQVLALAVVARQPAAGQRAPRDHAHAIAQAGGQHVVLDAAREQRVGRLLAYEALAAAPLGDPLGLDDLARGEGGRADVADLALAHEVGEGAERLVDVGVLFGAVDLVEVDPVGAEPPQAVLDLLDDPAARVPELVRVVAHRAVHLCCEHDVVAPAPGQRLADDLLGLAARVHVGGVDEVDPGVERGVDDADRLVVVLVAPTAEHHRAEAERTHLDAGAAEGAELHRGRD